MIPEKGDPSFRVTQEDVARGLAGVGVRPGDTVLFHSSLSSMGTVVGGADAVINGFLAAVGPQGTVAVPTLCNWTPGDEDMSMVFGRWDPRTSPSYVGSISETLRGRPEARRSDHATHSIAAIGARAEELTAGHGAGGERPGPFGPKAFARESPWQRLADWNAQYCFVGVTYRVNTMVHFVESLVVERALQAASPERRRGLAEKVSGWMRTSVWPTIRGDDREVIERLLADRGLVAYGKIGSATLRRSPAGDMVKAWLEIVEAEPERWFPEDFCSWLRST